MNGAAILVAFLVGAAAGMMLATFLFLFLALRATAKRQEKLDDLIAGGRR